MVKLQPYACGCTLFRDLSLMVPHEFYSAQHQSSGLTEANFMIKAGLPPINSHLKDALLCSEPFFYSITHRPLSHQSFLHPIALQPNSSVTHGLNAYVRSMTCAPLQDFFVFAFKSSLCAHALPHLIFAFTLSRGYSSLK